MINSGKKVHLTLSNILAREIQFCLEFCSDPNLAPTQDFYVAYDVFRCFILSRPQDSLVFIGGAGHFRFTGLRSSFDALEFNTVSIDGTQFVSIPALVNSAYEHRWLPQSEVSDRFRRVIYQLLK